MEQTECSETLAYKIQTLGNYPDESIQQFLVTLFGMMYLDKFYIVFVASPEADYSNAQ